MTKPTRDVCPKRPESEQPQALGFVRRSMVHWYAPAQLVRTGVDALLAGIFGTYADKREIEASLAQPGNHDYSDKSELWLDYVADLGDGWESTYTVARLLAEPALTPAGAQDKILPRGQVLVMGGDQVYPAASRTAYRDRLSGPYRAALPCQRNNAPHLYAIPGNHDWYDGLTSFMRLFCQERWIGGWHTQQRRSYFALRLPQRWWLLGLDIQLDNYIDAPQLEYFEQIASTMQQDARVILCSAEPSWIKQHQRNDDRRDVATKDNLLYFEEKILRPKGARVYLHIAGDLHHFCHYARTDLKRHRITSGGGGAFLHGTHKGLPDSLRIIEADGNESVYDRTSIYPERCISKRLAWRNLMFPWLNYELAALLGIFYLVFGWLLLSAPGADGLVARLVELTPDPAHVPRLMAVALGALIHSPTALGAGLLAAGGLIGGCDAPKGRAAARWTMGAIHGASHLALAIVLLWLLVHAKMALFGAGATDGWELAALGTASAVLGGLCGGLLFGVFLLLTHDWLGLNRTNAFSSLRIPDYKHFLRMHIDPRGKLRVYPVAVDRIPRSWTRNTKTDDKEKPWFEPEGVDIASLGHLIKDPIVIDPEGDTAP